MQARNAPCKTFNRGTVDEFSKGEASEEIHSNLANYFNRLIVGERVGAVTMGAFDPTNAAFPQCQFVLLNGQY